MERKMESVKGIREEKGKVKGEVENINIGERMSVIKDNV